MEKWDALVMLLRDNEMTDFLNTIYVNADQVVDLNKDVKSMILNTARE